MTGKYHIIKNFKKGSTIFHKIFGNVLTFLGKLKIKFRNNLLTHSDYKKTARLVKKGDIVVAGNLTYASSLVIPGPVTHSLLYVSKKKMIHSVVEGVCYINMKEIFKQYDTLAILRPKINSKKRKKIIHKAIGFAKKQLGKPYDFYFKNDIEDFFCTQLVDHAYRQAGFDLKAYNTEKNKHILDQDLRKIKNVIYPVDFIKAKNLELIFLSHNLTKNEKGDIVIKDD